MNTKNSAVLSGNISLAPQELSLYIDKLAQNVVKYLNRSGLKLATAESCTGGMLSQAITSVPGASAVFECGVVSYSERIKSELLGVDPSVIERRGVVSPEVAELMAKGAARLSGAQVSVGITGIAGPGGGSAEQPVGTVYVSVLKNGRFITRNLELYRLGELTREQIRLAAAAYSLETILND